MKNPVTTLVIAALGSLTVLAAGAVKASPGVGAITQPPSAWSWSATAAVRESFDSNVYLQSVTDLANQESFVTSLLPQAGVTWKPGSSFQAALTYAPEIAFYHEEPGENFVLHRANLTFKGNPSGLSYELANAIVHVDGNHLGPTWTGAGGPPAAGGIPLRDRRDATILRNNWQVTYPWHDWWARFLINAYIHDFHTDQQKTAGYQNYADRREGYGGIDSGRKITGETSVYLGYRFGIQDQSRLLDYPEEYDSSYHRFLAGAEGKPWSWMKVAASLGPEIRRFGNRVPASFGDRDEWNLFVDVSVTLLPTSEDTILLCIRQFEQPGFGGRSVYEDLTYDLTWRRKVSERVAIGAGGRAYNTDFLAPAARNDWILSGNALLSVELTRQVSAEASYLYERGLSEIAGLDGRDYDRHLVAVGAKYIFH